MMYLTSAYREILLLSAAESDSANYAPNQRIYVDGLH